MAKQTINIGTAPNDGTGTPLRTAFDYCNLNFTELYTAVGPSGNNIVVPGTATITGDLTVATDRLKVVTGSTAVQIGATTQTQIGTTAWPSTDIGKSNARFLVGNEGIVINWNESSPVIGNYSSIFAGAKTGIGATTIGGLQIRAGIENASNRDGFCSFWTSNQAAGGYVKRYEIDSNGVSTWSVGGSTAMTLNSTGLGVGMTPASSQSRVQIYQALGTTVNGALHITDNATTSFLFNNTSSGVSSIWTSGILTFSTGSNAYSTNGARMTLDASGNLLVGKTASSTTVAGSQVQPDGTFSSVKTDANPGFFYNTTTAISGTIALFRSNGVTVGSISQDGTNTAYNNSSDYRLKESVQPLTGGLDRVNALKPSIYKWKTNGKVGEGFLAHELAEVVPFAVTGEKDAVTKDGEIEPQQVDLSKVVPILVAAIKELTARVEALEA
jgi:hypothetical protein